MPPARFVTTIWQRLNQPLPGTSPRQPVVWVEGRIRRSWLVAGGLLALLGLVAGVAAEMAGWIRVPSLHPFKPYFAWAEGMMCEAGWRGYSKGMLALAAAYLLFALLPLWLMCVAAWVQARRLVRRQTNMPASGRPWLPLRLVEGPAAVRQGRMMQLGVGLMVCWLLWMSFGLFPELLKMFLVPPSELKTC